MTILLALLYKAVNLLYTLNFDFIGTIYNKLLILCFLNGQNVVIEGFSVEGQQVIDELIVYLNVRQLDSESLLIFLSVL